MDLRLSRLLVDNHPALFSATSVTDPTGALLVYGPLGIFAALLVYVVRSLYSSLNHNFQERLADKDKLIAEGLAREAKKDQTIDMLLRHGQNTLPALERAAQVMEILPQKTEPSEQLAKVGEILPRLLEVLQRVEGQRNDH